MMTKSRMLLLAAGVALLALPSLAAEPAPKAVAAVKTDPPALADLTQGALFVPESSESDGSVTVEGHYVGRLRGLAFDSAKSASALEGKALRAAAEQRPDVVINFLGYELAELQLDYEAFRGRVAQYVFISSASVTAKPHTALPITARRFWATGRLGMAAVGQTWPHKVQLYSQ